MTRHIKAKHAEDHPILECNDCKKQFKTQRGLDGHIKRYHGSTTTSDAPHALPQIVNIHNTTNNNNTTTNNITNFVFCNRLVYDDNGVQFLDDHITKKDLKRMMKESNNETLRFMVSYGQELLKKSENRVARKKHITSGVCEVHVGGDQWHTRPDSTVVKRICQDMATSANDKLYVYPDVGQPQVRQEISDLASYDDELDKNKVYKQEVRAILHNTTKASLCSSHNLS